MRLLQEALVIWALKQTSQSRSFGKRKNCASLMLSPLSWDVPDLIPENCVRMHAILCPPESLWTPSTTPEDLSAGRPSFSCHSSFYVFGASKGQNLFPVAIPSHPSNTEPKDELEADRSLFPVARSTSLPDESCGDDVEDDPLPELVDNPRTTRGTKLSALQIIFSSLVTNGF